MELGEASAKFELFLKIGSHSNLSLPHPLPLPLSSKLLFTVS